jgi:hypothetical protein
LSQFTGLQYSVFIEECHFDLKHRKLTVITVNDTFSKKAVLTDYSTYEAFSENPGWTVFKQMGKIEILMSTLGFTKKIETFLLDTYSRRYEESRKLDEKMIAWYIQNVKAVDGSIPDEASRSTDATKTEGKEKVKDDSSYEDDNEPT